MTLHTGASGERLRASPGMFYSGMAIFATFVIMREISVDRVMRGMAGEAGKASTAGAIADARCERKRLVAGIPGIAEVSGFRGSGGHPMAIAAECVDGVCGVAAGIVGNAARRVADMIERRTMAGFAADAEFVRDDGVFGS